MSGLYQIQHDTPGHLYCGPAALCAVTGEPSSVVLAAVRDFRRDSGNGPHYTRPVKAMWTFEIERVLQSLGFPCVRRPYTTRERPTFSAWRRGRSVEFRRLPSIVLVTGHFVAVAGNLLVDSCHRDPIYASDYMGQRTRVRSVVTLRGFA